MKRFRWSLQRLLDVTIQRERAAEARVADLAGKLAAAREEASRRRRRLEADVAELREMTPAERFSAQTLCLRYLKHAQNEIERIEQTAADVDRRRREALAEYVQQRRSRQTLERLREEALDAHRQAERAEEQKQLDDLAGIRFSRGTRPIEAGSRR